METALPPRPGPCLTLRPVGAVGRRPRVELPENARDSGSRSADRDTKGRKIGQEVPAMAFRSSSTRRVVDTASSSVRATLHHHHPWTPVAERHHPERFHMMKWV